MREKTWFLHVSGEAVGPFSTGALTKMLQGNRCNAADYIACEGSAQWTRVADCGEFAGALSGTPKIAVPGAGSAPKAKAAPALKAAPEPKPAKAEKKVAVEAPAPVAVAPAPKPMPVEAPARPMLPIDAKVKVNGGAVLKVYVLSETSVLFEASAKLEMGSDVKLRLEAPSIAKPVDLTGVLANEAEFNGKPAMGIEFTRMNPTHRRVIAQYLAEHGASVEKAA